MTTENKQRSALHVYPIVEEQIHELEGFSCWCHPDILNIGAIEPLRPIVVHREASRGRV